MFDLISLIKTVGYIGLAGIVFAESGLLIGFFLPGDSLLFTAGFLASQGYLNIWWTVVLLFIAAVVGDSFGYGFGRRVGHRIFKREDSFWFHKNHLVRANRFFEIHGGKTIILARFLPVVRTFAPILAGVGRMNYRTFLFYNVIGGALWVLGLGFLGYFLGSVVPNIDKYIFPIIAAIVVLSIAPTVIHVLKDQSTRRQIWDYFKHGKRKTPAA